MLKEPDIYLCLLMNHIFQTSLVFNTSWCNVIEINWLCKHSKSRNRYASVSVNPCTKLSRTAFVVSIINHRTIIRTGITCMLDPACRWINVEYSKIFWSYVRHFWIFSRERICRILIGLCESVFINHAIMFIWLRQ